MIPVLILVIIIITIYLIPAPKGDFFKLYTNNDPVAHRLMNFRARPLKTVRVEGIRWKYYSGGKGEKTLLFIHGMGGAYDIWWNQITALEKEYRVITYTLPKEINSLKKAKAGILAVLEQENVDRIVMIGTSMGGYIAQYLVKTMPARIEKAVFGNTFPPNRLYIKVNKKKRTFIPWLPEIIVWRSAQQELEQKLLPAGHHDKLLAAFLPGLSFSKKQLINRYDVVTDGFNITSETQSIENIPKLIFESDNDPLVPTLLRAKLKLTYPEARVHSFHNEGHFPYLTAMKEYNRILTGFLKS